jgi:toxin ParE1/3/4
VTSYRITVTARAQIAALYAWSIERWGAAHARRYLEDLDAGVRDLIETPALASPRPDLDPRLFIRRVRAHHLYVAFQPEGLVVVAVLHHRMDAVRHLGAALEELGSHRPRDR